MMNRQVFCVLIAICVLTQSSEAVRGALFRSGRSLIRQNVNSDVLNQETPLLPSDKRSPVVELYPVVDSGNTYPEMFRYFRI